MAATPREMSEMSKMGNLLSEPPKMGTFPTRQNQPFSSIGPVERLKGWRSEDPCLVRDIAAATRAHGKSTP